MKRCQLCGTWRRPSSLDHHGACNDFKRCERRTKARRERFLAKPEDIKILEPDRRDQSEPS